MSVRGTDLDSERILTREAFAESHRIYASTSEREDCEIAILSKELKETLKKELLSFR